MMSTRSEAIISFIDDIARRLQLLALNGNIIAAQAGDHGRSFRVVCRELGALADQAKGTAGDVRKLVVAMGLETASDDLELGIPMEETESSGGEAAAAAAADASDPG